MSSPPAAKPQFNTPASAASPSHETVWLSAILIACFFGWLALSIVILSTELIEPPARGIVFRLCLLATPFALGAAGFGIVVLGQRHDRLRAAEVQRADAMREPRAAK